MSQTESLFIENGIDPLLAEVPLDLKMGHSRQSGSDHPELRTFISRVFREHHGAEITSFYPNLIGFQTEGRLQAVVGYRDWNADAFFSEQYLSTPVEHLATELLGLPVAREELAEVGNLAISDPGQARWVISASTEFLAAAGYRWVMFTATRPLANAFGRLGLKPMRLAEADPARLPDKGASWGDYYTGAPQVYLGDIHAGRTKLHGHAQRHDRLHRLLGAARELAKETQAPAAAVAGIQA